MRQQATNVEDRDLKRADEILKVPEDLVPVGGLDGANAVVTIAATGAVALDHGPGDALLNGCLVQRHQETVNIWWSAPSNGRCSNWSPCALPAVR